MLAALVITAVEAVEVVVLLLLVLMLQVLQIIQVVQAVLVHQTQLLVQLYFMQQVAVVAHSTMVVVK
jgi:hypothetical protein